MTVVNILDDETVAGLELPRDQIEELFWDSVLKGFGLRLHWSTKGRLLRTWTVQYRHEGRQRKRKIGDHLLSPKKARQRAMQMLVKVAEGIDPAAEKDTQRSVLTFASAVAQYLELKKATVRASSLRLSTLYLTNPMYFGSLHSRQMNKITRGDISTAVNKITATGKITTARQARTHLSAFMTWSMQQGFLGDVNPAVGSANPGPAKARDRVLEDGELAAIWRACGDDDYGRIVRLLMLTGCRRSEIGGLKWTEIKDGTITLSGDDERTKNGYTHVLPITPMVAEIIENIPKRIDRDHLFGERAANGFKSFDNHSLDVDGITEPWRLHDLRRTMATRMADLGIEPHIIEAILNHQSGHKKGDHGTYNRSNYKQQVIRALNLWDDHIASIVGDRERKVVPLHVA